MKFVIYCEDGVWVAHGLERNIVTHAESLSEIRDNIKTLKQAYTDYAPETLGALPQAPSELWNMFIRAERAGRDLDAHLNDPVTENEPYTMELVPA